MKIINKNFLILYFFHLTLSSFFNYLSYTPVLKELHNQKGIWNFMRDSSLYHNESLILLNYLQLNDFYNFFINFNAHINTKIIALLYFITSINMPIIYIPFHSLLWVITVIIIFKTTYINRSLWE